MGDTANKLSRIEIVGFVLTFIAVLLYSILFFKLFPEVGKDVRIMTVLPAVIAASFLGVRWGLIIAFFTNLVTTPMYLYELTGEKLGVIYVDNIVGILLTCVVALIIGSLHDMYGKIKKLNSEITRLSRRDHLTGILNRRALYEMGNQELKRSMRQKRDVSFYMSNNATRHQMLKEAAFEYSAKDRSFKEKGSVEDYVGIFSCAIIDVDFFKKINDTYGHLIGDKVLKIIAKILSGENILRGSDIVGRFGGEEFVIIFPGTTAENSIYPLKKISEEIRSVVFETEGGEALSNVTVSCGVSQLAEMDNSLDDIIKRADEALYYAKEHGRDQIVVYEAQFKPSMVSHDNSPPPAQAQNQ